MLDSAVHTAKSYIIGADPDSANHMLQDVIQDATQKANYSDSAIELLPAYITMAEAYVCKGGKHLKKGEKLLIVAYWNLLKQTSEENKNTASEQTLVTSREIQKYRASLHKAFGRLFTAQKRLD